MQTNTQEMTLFTEIIDLLEIEELLRLRKRCQMRGKLILAAILNKVIEERDGKDRPV